MLIKGAQVVSTVQELQGVLKRNATAEEIIEPQRVLDVLHEALFIDKAPAQVDARLLEEANYLGFIRTIDRICTPPTRWGSAGTEFAISLTPSPCC